MAKNLEKHTEQTKKESEETIMALKAEKAERFADDLMRDFLQLGSKSNLTNLRRKSGLWKTARNLFIRFS